MPQSNPPFLDWIRQVFHHGQRRTKLQAFTKAMPRVTPFYAVKCNPDGMIMRALAALGCGFDCASAREMADTLAMGVPPEHIIFAHPCKRPADLDYAVSAGVMVRRAALVHCAAPS
jgi:ornithine decarboxylase